MAGCLTRRVIITMIDEKPVQLRDGRIVIVKSLNGLQRIRALGGVIERKVRLTQLALENKGINHRYKNLDKLAEIYLDKSDRDSIEFDAMSIAMINMVMEASFSLDTDEPLYHTTEEVRSARAVDVLNLFSAILSISGLTSPID